MSRGKTTLICAWILWSYSVGETTFIWHPSDSFEKLVECKREAMSLQRINDSRKKESGRAREYMCLPDTVNPMIGNPKL